MSSNSPKIVTIIRAKNEGRWLPKVFESLKGISSDIIVLDGNSTDNSLEICNNCPDVVQIIHQGNRPFDETRDKNELLEAAKKLSPDFILTLDGDEVLSPNTKDILFEEIENHPSTQVFEFQSLFIWDKPNQYRYDGIFEITWQKRLLRMKNQLNDLHFNEMNFPGNMHCPPLPQNSIGLDSAFKSRIKILHYGYFDEAVRKQKFEIYIKRDPKNIVFDGYKHILSGKSKFSGQNGMKFKFLPESMFIKDI